jgi:3-methyladenine DNA glycosylase/8-oxoguanine DNA glycosylase
MARASWKGARIYTVGHSTRTLDELVALLRAFDISVLVDIRTIPRSRHNPQFNSDSLGSALGARGFRYAHLPRLGGLRRARKDSLNTGWRNASFRGFADYMATEDFEAGLRELRALTAEGTVALMCAEAVPWRCHRSLVADALTARGALVEHVTGASRATPHRLTAFAKVRGANVTYPGQEVADGRLTTQAPFHLEATVRVLQRRPTNLVDLWERDRYLRVLQSGNELILVEVANRGTVDDPDLRLCWLSGVPSPAAQVALGQTMRKVLGLDVDPEPLQSLVQAERKLRPTAEALRGMRPPRFAGLFEAFATVVPFQQVSLDSGVAVVGRLVQRFGNYLEHEGRRFHAFPTAATIAEARPAALRACGLSLRKADSLRFVARAIASGKLTEDQLAGYRTIDALKMLTELPGIGPWSAGLVLLRGFGRLDVIPAGDVGAQRGLGELLHLAPGGEPLDRIVERFGAHRGYLYFCALGSKLLARGLIQPAPRVGRSARSRAIGVTRDKRGSLERVVGRGSSAGSPRL